MPRILVTGLNPAWQNVYLLPDLRPEGVQRATEFHALASGKGMNAAKVLARLGHEVSLLQVLAGENGRRCLEACEELGIRSLHVWSQGETRVCTSLLHGGGKTAEVIAPFRAMPVDLARELPVLLPPGESWDAVLVCGSIPDGLPATLCADIVARAPSPLVIWDSVAPWNAEVAPRITWLKVNAEEYAALASLREELPGARQALVTAGAEPVHVHGGEAAGRYVLPEPGEVLNPVGAGDTVTAMLADGLLRGLDARAAVARALAAAAASCRHPLPAEWDATGAERIEKKILWTQK